jgi:hypothetical protein
MVIIMCYCPSKTSGIMYYNPSILSDEKYVSLVYKILNKNSDTARVMDTEHIRNMVHYFQRVVNKI